MVSAESYNNRLIREVLQTEIDVMNIRTLLRTIRDHVDAGEAAGLFLEGGKVFDTKALGRLAALHSTEDFIHELDPTPYRMLTGVAETALRNQKISIFEKELEKFLIKKGVDSFAKDPLSVASLIGYFWAKYNEMTNIRIISRCKIADVPDDFLREELVYV
jgi:V/A-type H+-transporting ATPase subunit C